MTATVFPQGLTLFDPRIAANPVYGSRVFLFTPEIARQVLDEHAAPNRRINQATVARYRQDMLSGDWTFNGETMSFSTEGLLIDGQHRLAAVAGLPDTAGLIQFAVVTGLPPEAIIAMNQGDKRTGAQQLALRGHKHSAMLSAAAKLVYSWEHGTRTYSGFAGKNAVVSTPRLERWVTDNAPRVEYVLDHVTLFRTCGTSPSAALGAGLILADIDPHDELAFFTALVEGGEPKGSPILTLDKRLARMSRDGHHYRGPDYLGMIFRAWNAWRKNERLDKIIRPSEMTTFPVPV